MRRDCALLPFPHADFSGTSWNFGEIGKSSEGPAGRAYTPNPGILFMPDPQDLLRRIEMEDLCSGPNRKPLDGPRSHLSTS